MHLFIYSILSEIICFYHIDTPAQLLTFCAFALRSVFGELGPKKNVAIHLLTSRVHFKAPTKNHWFPVWVRSLFLSRLTRMSRQVVWYPTFWILLEDVSTYLNHHFLKKKRRHVVCSHEKNPFQEDLRTILKWLTCSLPAKALQVILNETDADGSGTISQREYLRCLRSGDKNGYRFEVTKRLVFHGISVVHCLLSYIYCCWTIFEPYVWDSFGNWKGTKQHDSACVGVAMGKSLGQLRSETTKKTFGHWRAD